MGLLTEWGQVIAIEVQPDAHMKLLSKGSRDISHLQHLCARLYTLCPPSFESFGGSCDVDCPALLPDFDEKLSLFLFCGFYVSKVVADTEQAIFESNVFAKLMKSFKELQMSNALVSSWSAGGGEIQI